MFEKSFEPNRVYVLSELEKYVERDDSLIGEKYKNINELIAAKKRLKNLDAEEKPFKNGFTAKLFLIPFASATVAS